MDIPQEITLNGKRYRISFIGEGTSGENQQSRFPGPVAVRGGGPYFIGSGRSSNDNVCGGCIEAELHGQGSCSYHGRLWMNKRT